MLLLHLREGGREGEFIVLLKVTKITFEDIFLI
jgi:hypothetical protein